jgi:hypothetical protein
VGEGGYEGSGGRSKRLELRPRWRSLLRAGAASVAASASPWFLTKQRGAHAIDCVMCNMVVVAF